MNAFTQCTCFFCDGQKFAAIKISEANIRKGCRKTYLFAEREYGIRFFGRNVSELQSC